MRGFKNVSRISYLEVVLHICYWLFHFASVNTNWDVDWTNRNMRGGIAQLTIVLYPVIFYANAFWLIPNFLKGKSWYRYFTISLGLTLTLEIIRSLYFVIHRGELQTFKEAFMIEFLSIDNLVFGLPNSLFFAFLFSTVYRFTRDWIVNQRVISSLQMEKMQMLNKLDEIESRVSNHETLDSQDLVQRLTSVIQRKRKAYKSTLQAKRRDEVYILKVQEIAYLKAQGDFVLAIDIESNSFIINYNLSIMEELLDPLMFFRINRSEIVNALFVLKYSNHTKNRLEISLRDSDEKLYTSNSRTPEFRKWLDNI